MTWLAKLFGSDLRDETGVQADLEAALAGVPGVTARVVHFRSLPKGAGVVAGHVDVPDKEAYARALVAVARALGKGRGRVTIGLTGSGPSGEVFEGTDLGLFVRPSGTHVLEELGESGV